MDRGGYLEEWLVEGVVAGVGVGLEQVVQHHGARTAVRDEGHQHLRKEGSRRGT